MRVWDVKIHAPDDEGECEIEVRFSREDKPLYRTVLPPDVIDTFSGATPPGKIRGDAEVLDNSSILDAAADREAGQFLGYKLLEALLSDRSNAKNYVEKLIDDFKGERAEQSRLLFRLDLSKAGRLSDLPWELMYAKDTAVSDFLATSESFGLARYREPLGLPPPPAAHLPLKILMVVADPTGQLATANEVENLKAALAGIQAGTVELLDPPLLAATRADFARRVNSDRPHVIHFIGHGSFDGKTGRLHLHDEADREVIDHVDAQGLSTILKNDRPWLIFLNACEGAVDGSATRFGGLAQELLGIGVPFVIAMRRAITDVAARDFATSFYRDFTRMPLTQAVARGRNLLLASNAASFEFATPALYSSLLADDGDEGDRIALVEGGPPGTPRRRIVVVAAAAGGLALAALGGFVFSQWLGTGAEMPRSSTPSSSGDVVVVARDVVLAAPPPLAASPLPQSIGQRRPPSRGPVRRPAGNAEGAYGYAPGYAEEVLPAPGSDGPGESAGPDESAGAGEEGGGPAYETAWNFKAGNASAGLPKGWEWDRSEPGSFLLQRDTVQGNPTIGAWLSALLGLPGPNSPSPCDGQHRSFDYVGTPAARSDQAWAPLRETAEMWGGCRDWTVSLFGRPSADPDPLRANAQVRFSLRLTALDLAETGVPASQIEEQVQPLAGNEDQGEAHLVRAARAQIPLEWVEVEGSDRMPRKLARAWAEAAEVSMLRVRAVRWNFPSDRDAERTRAEERLQDAFEDARIGQSLALDPVARRETDERAARPLVEARFDLGGATLEPLRWTPGQDALGDGEQARLAGFVEALSEAASQSLWGNWRVLIEGHSLRGETDHARLQDGLLAAAEVQQALAGRSLPAARVVTLSCGSKRSATLPPGIDRMAELSIVPDGMASPDEACGWSRPEALAPPPQPDGKPVDE